MVCCHCCVFLRVFAACFCVILLRVFACFCANQIIGLLTFDVQVDVGAPMVDVQTACLM